MKKSFAIVLGLALFTACSEAPKDSEVQETQETTTSENEVIDVTPNHMLTMEVSGMSCEMACGGAIREGLIETGAVSRVQYIDFSMDQETNVAKVYFDDTKISQEKIIEIVTALNEKQFTVGKTRLDTYSEKTSSLEYPETKLENDTKNGINISSEIVELPNLLDLLSSIVLN